MYNDELPWLHAHSKSAVIRSAQVAELLLRDATQMSVQTAEAAWQHEKPTKILKYYTVGQTKLKSSPPHPMHRCYYASCESIFEHRPFERQENTEEQNMFEHKSNKYIYQGRAEE